MEAIVKLLLSSFGPSPEHDAALADLAGKPLEQIRVAYIENTVRRVTDAQALVIDGDDQRIVGPA